MGGQNATLQQQQDALKNVVTATVDAYNNCKIYGPDGVEKYLDDNATVCSGSLHKAYHTKTAALAYLQDNMNKKKPKFALPKFDDPETRLLMNKHYNAATISGKTIWTDERHQKGEEVLFNFTFIWKNEVGWLFSSLWVADLSKSEDPLKATS